MLTLDQAIHAFLDARIGLVSVKTLTLNEHYLQSLAAFLGDGCVDTITLNDLRAWRTALLQRNEKYRDAAIRTPVQGKLSPFTVHLHLRTARLFFKWLTEQQLIARNPAASLEMIELPQPQPKAISDADIEKLLQAARAATAPERDAAIILFLKSTGCRLGGIAGLTLDALDLDRRRALVYEKGRGGQKKARFVYLKPEAVCALRAWLAVRQCISTSSTVVFVSLRQNKGKPLGESGIYDRINHLARRAGIQGRFNPHAFRHRLARQMLINGAALGQVSRILGHTNVLVTDQYYGAWADAELEQAHEQFA